MSDVCTRDPRRMSILRDPGAVRVARDCWVPAEAGNDLVTVCAEVLRSSAPDSVIVGVTAARLHALWLPDLPETIHVATATPGRLVEDMTRTRRPELRARRVALRSDEITHVDGIRVTTLARTWRDLGAVLPLPALVAAGDSALRAGATDADISAALATGRNVRGIRRARLAAPLLDRRSRSRPESHLRVAANAGGRLTFAVNESVHRDEGGWLAEPDLSLAEAKIALEYQGADHAEVGRMRRDLTRFADLSSEGWLVFAYGPAEVFRRPESVTAEVCDAVRVRAPQLLAAR